MAFSENLKRARESNNMTQLELAQSVGVSQPTIAQYERGLILPTIVTGVSIAKALRTTCEDLVEDRTIDVYDNIVQALTIGNLSEDEKQRLVKAWISVQKERG